MEGTAILLATALPITKVSSVVPFVKWDGNTIPSSVDSLITKEGPYTYTEIIDILNGPEWTSNEMI